MSRKRKVVKTSGSARGKRKQQQSSYKWIWISVIGLLIILVGGTIYLVNNSLYQQTSLAPEISVAEAYGKYQTGTFLLDVRTLEEWEEYHIPGTTLVPLDELNSRVGELPRDQEIVVVCRSGNRSQAGRDILKESGFSQVASMAGGLVEWEISGYPVVSGP